ncbi:MAG: methyltransferase domain-containing protein [Rhodospirillales bacterium]
MTQTPQADPIEVFDRRAVRAHRERAAARFGAHDFLIETIAAHLAGRLDDIKRTFPAALDLGCHGGQMAAHLAGRAGIDTLIQSDLSPAMARRARERFAATAATAAIAADEEWLPFAPHSFDLVISCLSLHWVNDLPGTLAQIRRTLKPDGLFLAALLGGETLKELRQTLNEAEIAEEGGLSPRVSPFADVRDAGNLLQRAGFTLPVADLDTLTVSYPHALKLMADLRGMGESNAVAERRKRFSRRGTIMRAAARYLDLFGDGEGRVPATFQVVYLTAWTPHPDQQKPLKPGSAEARLANALDSREIAAGDKAKP